MKYLTLAVFILGLSSCESSTSLQAILRNETSHQVNVYFYTDGTVDPGDTLSLAPSAEVPIASAYQPGMGSNLPLSSEYLDQLGPDDSVVVLFDGQHPVVHYKTVPVHPASKHLEPSSDRNVTNGPGAYQYVSEKKSARHQTATYQYTFTDSDYQFAVQ